VKDNTELQIHQHEDQATGILPNAPNADDDDDDDDSVLY